MQSVDEANQFSFYNFFFFFLFTSQYPDVE